MGKVIIEDKYKPSAHPKMKDDRIIRQTFTCCCKQLEKFLWEGWDWINGDIISEDILKEFKYCPYCGEKIDE